MWSKSFLTFLFFLVLSAGFWVFQSLNEVYEEEFEVQIDTKHVPRGIVITSELPQSIRITLKDRGVTLVNYKYGDKLPRFTIPAGLFTAEEGHIRILATDILKIIRPALASGTQVVSIKPDTLDFFYNRGSFKRLPVKISGRPTVATGFTITNQRVIPDSVTIYASNALLDTLRYVDANASQLRDIKATSEHHLKILPLRGAKCIPGTVSLRIEVDRLVEKKLTIPIEGENVPQGMQLRTFPSQVEITFQVSMSLYRDINAEQFAIVADYNRLKSDGKTKCPLSLKRWPASVSHIRLADEEVEYVIEQNNE